MSFENSPSRKLLRIFSFLPSLLAGVFFVYVAGFAVQVDSSSAFFFSMFVGLSLIFSSFVSFSFYQEALRKSRRSGRNIFWNSLDQESSNEP